MASMMNMYKNLPQTKKNYIQLGAVGAAMIGVYFRDNIMETFRQTRQSRGVSPEASKNNKV
ncbi:hypothetical protein BGX27_010308 [Mortierella sp. AM989]|nr:hypothetical protein BGX27_010308 [Mortierella sp. AM989]